MKNFGIIKEIVDVKELLNYVSKQFGVIVDTQPVVINGDKGFLIWDYVLFNEITFVNSQTKDYTSMFTSWSDDKTKVKFNELVNRYGN
ncbi:MAG: hypothetical protein ACRCXT_10460 [Paraclostridium sp.]